MIPYRRSWRCKDIKNKENFYNINVLKEEELKRKTLEIKKERLKTLFPKNDKEEYNKINFLDMSKIIESIHKKKTFN